MFENPLPFEKESPRSVTDLAYEKFAYEMATQPFLENSSLTSTEIAAALAGVVESRVETKSDTSETTST